MVLLTARRGLPAIAVAVSGCSVAPPAGGENSETSVATGSGQTEEGSEAETGPEVVCPADGPEGTVPGQILANVQVQPCEGELVGLRDLACGHKLTLIDIGAAAFQACVDATDLYATDPEYDALQDQGLHIVQVFLQDYQGLLPTKSFCSDYAAEHLVDFEFLIDQIGATDDIAPVHPFNVVLDQEARVVHVWIEDIPENRAEILGELLQEQ